jgi:hypothetical protein
VKGAVKKGEKKSRNGKERRGRGQLLVQQGWEG